MRRWLMLHAALALRAAQADNELFLNDTESGPLVITLLRPPPSPSPPPPSPSPASPKPATEPTTDSTCTPCTPLYVEVGLCAATCVVANTVAVCAWRRVAWKRAARDPQPSLGPSTTPNRCYV